MKWSVVFTGDNLTLDKILSYAKEAKEAGADCLWTTGRCQSKLS